jgi:two-component system, cell cycle response regulator
MNWQWFPTCYQAGKHRRATTLRISETGVSVNGERIKVLLIDSNRDFVYLISKALAQVGGQQYEVFHTEQISDALVQLATTTYDAVVMDISLLEPNNFETLTHVRVKAPDTPVVVLTADDNMDVALKAMRRGAQDYLVKGRVTGQLLIRSLRYAIERQQMVVTLRRLAMIDELTGLYNRQGFCTLAQQHVRLAHRQESPLVIIRVDITGMGKINKKHGYEAGDTALIRTAEILKRTFRSSDILARINGDEFLILALDVSAEKIEGVSTRINQTFARANILGELPFSLEVSIHVTPLPLIEDVEIEKFLPEPNLAAQTREMQV